MAKTITKNHREGSNNVDVDSIGTNKNTNILAPFNPTNDHAQNLALELLSLREDDVLFDLGCGDARILIAAAARTPSLRCVGVEIDPRFYHRANEAIASYRVGCDSDDDNDLAGEDSREPIKHRIHIHLGDALSLNQTTGNGEEDYDNDQRSDTRKQDIRQTDPHDQRSEALNNGVITTAGTPNFRQVRIPASRLSLLEDATCVFLYLLPQGLEKVKSLLEICFKKDRCIAAADASGNRSEVEDGNGGSVGRRRGVFRVVSYMFRIPGWKPAATREHGGGCCKIYRYDATSML